MAYQPDPEITDFAEKALAGRLEEFQGLLQEFTELISKRLADFAGKPGEVEARKSGLGNDFADIWVRSELEDWGKVPNEDAAFFNLLRASGKQ